MPCERLKLPGGGVAIICGPKRRPRPARCSVCGRLEAFFECDWSISSGSCDRSLCGVCAIRVDENVHHCPSHGFEPHAPPPGEPFILLVSGSRRLVEEPGASRLVHLELKPLVLAAEVIVTGDARGPDAWAFEEAKAAGRRALIYALDGTVREGLGGEELGRWTAYGPPERTQPAKFKAWCLLRNTVMVAHVARRRRKGRHAMAAGFLSAVPGTQGTEQTLAACDGSAFFVRRSTISVSAPRLQGL